MSIDKLKVLEKFPAEEKQNRLVQWIERKIYSPISRRVNWLLDRVFSEGFELLIDGNEPGDDGNWRFIIVDGVLLIQERVNGEWVSGTLTTGSGRIKNTSRYTTTQAIPVTDDVVFANTDGGAWTATLPVGVEGQTLKIINSGSSNNNLTIAPNGSEHLLGANSNFTLFDGETLIITFNSTDGWY